MMYLTNYTLLVLLACVWNSIQAPQEYARAADKEAKIVNEENLTSDGEKHKYSFETSNGIRRYETGELVKLDAGQSVDGSVAYRVSGGYSYPGPDGKEIIVTYVADENGFHPKIFRGHTLEETIPMFTTDDRITSNLLKSLVGAG